MSDTTSSAGSAKRSPLFRRLLIGSLVALAVLLVIVAMVPRVGASWMRESVEQNLSEETGLKVQIGSLSAGWFSSVSVGELSVAVPSGEQVIHIREVSTQKGLLGLMTRDKEVGDIYFDAPDAKISLDGPMIAELQEALAQMDTTKGYLKVIADPERDALVGFNVINGKVSIRTNASEEYQVVTDLLDAVVNLDREGESVQLDVNVLGTPVELSPVVCDYGLKFIAPVLAGALAIDGDCTLRIDKCHVDPSNWQGMLLEGNLLLHEVNAEVEGPTIKNITNAIGRIAAEDGEPQDIALSLQVSEESEISFSVTDGIVHHEGLAFGLPTVLPALVLRSSGDVGFDQSLDFLVQATIPFNKMGDDGLLQLLGAPSFNVPVQGTLAEPKVDIGQGKMLGNFVRDAVMNATDDQIDPGPLLKKIAESGVLKGDKTEGDANDSPLGGLLKRLRRPKGEEDDPGVSEATDEQMDDSGEKRRGGLLRRLRERRANRPE